MRLDGGVDFGEDLAQARVLGRGAALHEGARAVGQTTSSAWTQRRVEPCFTVCTPPELLAIIPPSVARAALDGSTGKWSACGAAAAFSSASVQPGRMRARRASSSTDTTARKPETRSTATPRPTFPPGIPVPAPRGTSAVRDEAAHATSAATSSTSAGTATASGSARKIPDASPKGVQRASSPTTSPRKPGITGAAARGGAAG
jgi:hypothetical protein